MKKDRAIIFDIDNTLVQTMRCKWVALKTTAKQYYNLDMTDAQIKKFWGTSFETMINNIFCHVDQFETILKHYIEVSKKYPMLACRSASETLNNLKDDYVLAALTSSSRSVIFKDLSDANIDTELFYFIQTSDDTLYHKPDPKVFNPTLKQLYKKNIEPNQTTYVGDALNDYLPSKSIGFHFIAVTTGYTSYHEFEKAGLEKKYILKNLSTLTKTLFS